MKKKTEVRTQQQEIRRIRVLSSASNNSCYNLKLFSDSNESSTTYQID